MDYELLLKKAEEIATAAHKGQYDRCGVEYINHPRTVASYVDEPKLKIIAWLHDTIEDTDITEADLRPVFGDDLTHNMKPDRIKNPTDRDYQRLEKYKKAYAILEKEQK